MAAPPIPTKQKFVPHKVLREGSIFVSVGGSDEVLEVKPVITKVMRVMGPDDKQLRNPDGSGAYQVFWNMTIIALSRKEWNVKKQMMENGEA